MINEIEKYLLKHYSPHAKDIKFLAKGMFSSAYEFSDRDTKKIIRLNRDHKDFLKDHFAERFRSKNIPIPKILKVDCFSSEYYCAISQKCEGNLFYKIPLAKKKNLSDQIFLTLLELHQSDIKDLSGFGNVDIHFNGKFQSWEECILNRENHKIAYSWNKIFSRDFFDKDLFENYQKQIKDLLKFLPKKRYLVHSDFGFDNLIVLKDKITGVIDWAEAKLGDFLYDVAWLNFWSEDINYGKIFKEKYSKANISIKHYEERLRCYHLVIGLGSLAIAGHFNKKDDYKYVSSLIKRLL